MISDPDIHDVIRDNLSMLQSAHIRRDYDGMAQYYHLYAQREFLGQSAAIPFAGRKIGREAIINSIRLIDTFVRMWDFTIDDLLVDGDRAAMRWRTMTTNIGTGTTADIECFDYIRFRDGLILERTTFYDTQSARRLLYPSD